VYADFLGRDARLVRRLSDAVGFDIWINTGIRRGQASLRSQYAREPAGAYGAGSRKAAPACGIKPRFIKTGVAAGQPDELDHQLIRAAAITSRETGLTAASHTGDSAAALEQIEIFASEK
jgi:phosphotriesterase-related protein